MDWDKYEVDGQMTFFDKPAFKINKPIRLIELFAGIGSQAMADLSYPTSTTRRGRVIDMGEVSPTIMANDSEICRVETTYRIRKLTPRECWRLMSFSDEDFEKAQEVNSNAQLYKEAGNSICKCVLMAIFKQMM